MSDDTQRILNELRASLHAHVDAAVDAVHAQVTGTSVNEPTPTDAVTRLSERLTDLEAVLDNMPAEGVERYQRGTEIHGKLRKTRKDLDALEQASPDVDTTAVRDEMRALTNRLLNEVFSVDPDVETTV
jgi:pyrimidine operon attenuation protein/uracil phosphoribosyltransferase